jgi:phenylpropionate dioxygenase-like ring-hydroxylating dioxygenase large terminal subunit
MATFAQADTGPLSPELRRQFEAICRPPLEARTLPPQSYWSPELYELEVKNVFTKCWVGVGRIEDIPNPGDFFTQDIAGESIIVVRDHEGEIRAHVNVCRHRGCQIVEGAGSTTAFKCPYHGWLYQLDGELRGAPEMGETKCFDKRDYPLDSVRVEVWEGFIVVNLDPDAAPFADQIRDTAKFGVEKYDMANHVTTARWEWTIECNWKAYVENYIEAYHVPGVHAETFQPVAPLKGWKDYPELSDEPWAAMVGLFPGLSYSDTSEPRFTVAPATADIPPEYSGMPIWVMFPGFGILNSVDATLYYMMLPDGGPDRMQLKVRLALPREDAERIERGDPDAVEAHEEYKRNIYAFVLEDNEIAVQQQAGLRSRKAHQGRFSKHELLAHKFGRWIAETAYLPE